MGEGGLKQEGCISKGLAGSDQGSLPRGLPHLDHFLGPSHTHRGMSACLQKRRKAQQRPLEASRKSTASE